MIDSAIPTLVLIGLAAVFAPIVAEWSRRFVAVPEVVIQILLGIVLGPYVLNLAHPNNIVTALSHLGLTYLMFLAGTELDLSTMRQGHLGRAAGSWGASLVLALGVGAFLHGTGLVLDSVVVALCLTTTALGTLLPILHDAGVLRTAVGPSILSVGAIGEFGPIVAVAVLLTNRDARMTFLLLGLFVAVAVVAALLATQVHPPRFIALMRRHLHSTAQLPVRISVLLVILLVYLARNSAWTSSSAPSPPASSCGSSSRARTASPSRASSRRSASASSSRSSSSRAASTSTSTRSSTCPRSCCWCRCSP